VCRLHKSKSHKVCKDFAGYGKNSMGYYYGIRLHLITDIDGNILQYGVTTTKQGEREWLLYQAQTTFKNYGILFVADKGYQGLEFQANIRQTGNHILTGIKQSKKNKLPLANWQMWLFQMRARIETCFGKLKTKYNLTSPKARSPFAFCFGIILSLFALITSF
jgi:hypothetical protein